MTTDLLATNLLAGKFSRIFEKNGACFGGYLIAEDAVFGLKTGIGMVEKNNNRFVGNNFVGRQVRSTKAQSAILPRAGKRRIKIQHKSRIMQFYADFNHGLQTRGAAQGLFQK